MTNLRKTLVAAGMALLASQASATDLKEGALAYSRGDLPAAVKHLRPLAEKGDATAQRLLGVALANAKRPLLNLAEGEEWLKKSVAQGNIAAMRDLGQLNMFGKTPPDRAEAEKWLLAAANRGDAESQHLMAVLLLDAKGADRRPAEAYRWLVLASLRGHLLSSVMLSTSSGQFSDDDRREGEKLAASWTPVR